jgi:hypothetical protein
MRNSLEVHRKTSSPPLFKIFMKEDVMILLMSLLSFQDIITLFQLCKFTRSWKRVAFSAMIRRVLGPYVPKPKDLLDKMRESDAIISGSSVLWLVQNMPHNWKPGDLDLYAPRDRAQPIIDFLRKVGYTEVTTDPTVSSEYLIMGQLHSITKMKKGSAAIDVMESSTDSAIQPLTVFHVTAVMNYLTADSIMVLYPQLTFSNYAVRHYGAPHRRTGWDSKYEERKFKLRYSKLVPTKLQYILCPSLDRHPGDKFSLSLSFHDGNIPLSRNNPTWTFVSFMGQSHHAACEKGLCYVDHYYQHSTDGVGVQVISKATIELYV